MLALALVLPLLLDAPGAPAFPGILGGGPKHCPLIAVPSRPVKLHAAPLAFPAQAWSASAGGAGGRPPECGGGRLSVDVEDVLSAAA